MAIKTEGPIYSSAQVAAMTDRTVAAIQKIAQRHPGIGQKLGGTWVFTAADVAAIRAIKREGGRPPWKAEAEPR